MILLIDSMNDFLIIENHKLNKQLDVVLTTEKSDKVVIQQYSGTNTENFRFASTNSTLFLSLFKLNGIWYININGEHVVNYKQFIRFQRVENTQSGIQIINNFCGNMNITNCKSDVFCKSISVISNWMKQTHPSSLWKELLYFFF